MMRRTPSLRHGLGDACWAAITVLVPVLTGVSFFLWNGIIGNIGVWRGHDVVLSGIQELAVVVLVETVATVAIAVCARWWVWARSLLIANLYAIAALAVLAASSSLNAPLPVLGNAASVTAMGLVSGRTLLGTGRRRPVDRWFSPVSPVVGLLIWVLFLWGPTAWGIGAVVLVGTLLWRPTRRVVPMAAALTAVGLAVMAVVGILALYYTVGLLVVLGAVGILGALGAVLRRRDRAVEREMYR